MVSKGLWEGSSQEGEALLLARQLEEVGAGPHDGGAAGGHLEDLLLLRLPRDDVELLLLCSSISGGLGL